MNCDEFQEQIPSYIKKEMEGEQRVLLKSHLKRCVDCREDYLLQVKMHYIIDRQEILEPDPETSIDIKEKVLESIDQSSDKKGHVNMKWLWYAAAAILLIGITIGRFVIPNIGSQKYISQNGDETLSELIVSEDWNKLEIVLSDKDEFSKYSTDSIPIHILLEKLSALQKMGIQSLPIAGTFDNNNAIETANIQNDPQIQISLSDFIRLLEQAKRQRSQITLDEVSKLLTTL